MPAEEAGHAARVMRAAAGDRVVLFCGDGREAEAEIASVAKRHVFVHAHPPQEISREAEFALTVAVSLPKGDRARGLVERLTELGVATMQPVICERTQSTPSRAAIEKLRRGVIEGSKQCGRNQLMQIAEPVRFADYLAQSDPDAVNLIAHPDGHSFAATLQSAGAVPAAVAVGPEGGFTEEEVQQAVNSGWQRVTLGPRILRIETAAAAVVARLVLH